MVFNINGTQLILPDSAEEVSFARGLAFDIEGENIQQWVLKEVKEETIETNRNYYLYLIAKAISNFCDFDFNKILMWSVDDLVDEEGQLYPQVLQIHLGSDKYERGAEVENQLVALYTYIKDILTIDYKIMEGDYFFTYQGVEYQIPYLIKKVLGKPIYSSITIGQTVDILKIYKYFKALGTGYVEDVTEKQNKIYMYYLQILSILAIPKGSSYPNNPEKARKYVLDQMILFKDIDYRTINQVLFFLTRTILA